MEYTHYWKRTRQLTDSEMLTIGAKVRKIINEAEGKPGIHNYSVEMPVKPLIIAGAIGVGSPEINKDIIRLNGDGELAHETFCIVPTQGTDSCKMAQKPYDVVVVACLTFLAAEYGFRVSSDGDHDELQRGVDLCGKALGKEYPHPLTVEVMTRHIR